MNTLRKMVVSWLVALLAMAATGTALAHAALVKSEPARRATLSKPPPQVRLWFNERLEPEYATISVIKEGAGPVTTQTARVDKDDPKLLVDLAENFIGSHYDSDFRGYLVTRGRLFFR